MRAILARATEMLHDQLDEKKRPADRIAEQQVT
jgi:hypothetical protein